MRLFTLPLSTSAVAFFSGSGSFVAVGSPSNLSVASFAGAGSFNAVGASTGIAVASFTGSGNFTGAGVGPPPAVASFTGSGGFLGVAAATGAGVATFVGSGVFSASAFTSNAVGNFTGGGSFNAQGGWSNLLPFNEPPSWSIMIYGSIILGAGYDPLTRSLKVWYTNSFGQFIILQNLPDQVTNAIEDSKDRQAYVLALIKNNVGVPS